MGERIYLSPPDITEVEKALVMNALDFGWVAPLGPHVDVFEEELAAFVGVHAGCRRQGRAALHLGCPPQESGPAVLRWLPVLRPATPRSRCTDG